jgi:haloacetate dehalogenase
MSNLAHLLPGFDEMRISTGNVELHVRTGGEGLPLLLLHGYPQSQVCWHRVAPELARHFRVVLLDLPGYGRSSCPVSDEGHTPYSKRAMAQSCRDVMETLGFPRFGLVGHDRGGRVAYRLALDHPEVVTRLAILDVVPTYNYFLDWSPADAIARFHWPFMAQPEPFPESFIASDPVRWMDYLLAKWSGSGDLTAFDPEALCHYRECFKDLDRIHATCEDYRAGATVDFAQDEADLKAGRKIQCPLLVLWGPGKTGGFAKDPLRIWRMWCENVDGGAVNAGHFIPEEDPRGALDRLLPFFLPSWR